MHERRDQQQEDDPWWQSGPAQRRGVLRYWRVADRPAAFGHLLEDPQVGLDDPGRRPPAESIKRIARKPRGITDAAFDWTDDRAAQRPEWIAAFLEMKTVWHPIGG